MSLLAIMVLAGGTYVFRLAGPVLRDRVRIPDEIQRRLAVAAAVLLIALAATGSLTEDRDFAGWARLSGALVAGILSARRAPFPLVVVAAAATTATLRLTGVT